MRGIRFSEHLKATTLVRAGLEDATDALRESLARFGPTTQTGLSSWKEVAQYLCPLKSFTTRFVCISNGDWARVMTDMKHESGFVDGLAISRRLGCEAVQLTATDTARFVRLVSSGDEVRTVACYEDDGPWVFVAEGTPAPWERVEQYQRRRIRDRLTPALVEEYLAKVSRGVTTALVPHGGPIEAFGVQRSLTKVVARILEFETEVDL